MKFTDKDFELDVRADSEKETVWLTQEEIALLFNTARSTITYHINKIFSAEELDKNTSVEKFDGRVNYRPAKLYNLDVILLLAIGFNPIEGFYLEDGKQGLKRLLDSRVISNWIPIKLFFFFKLFI